jgi:16S rRNA (guanine966-N2)-methyltransferase
MIPPSVKIIERENLLIPDGIIVTKIDASEKIYIGTSNIILTDHRKYGNTTLCFYKYKED